MWHCLNHYAYSDAIFFSRKTLCRRWDGFKYNWKILIITISYFYTCIAHNILLRHAYLCMTTFRKNFDCRNLPIQPQYSIYNYSPGTKSVVVFPSKTTQSTFNFIPGIQLHNQIPFQWIQMKLYFYWLHATTDQENQSEHTHYCNKKAVQPHRADSSWHSVV